MHGYDGLSAFYGDIHNHCDISYGHGSLEMALANGRKQLDFCSITGHASWPDMPAPSEEIQYLIDYHKVGFKRLRENWELFQQMLERCHLDGEFVTFLGFEIHISSDGDRTIIYKSARGPLLEAGNLEELENQLRALIRQGVEVIAFPHHIGYKTGHRGINWRTFHSDVSPVVEIVSMHGCSEADEAPRPFLHVMGPLDHRSNLQYGLSQGHIFGVLGNTDHHSAFPGSYGHGRTGVWARAKTRDAIWEAIRARRTFALTGDRIALQFAINGKPMGSVLEASALRHARIIVNAGGAIDSVDLIKNGRLLRRCSQCDFPVEPLPETVATKIYFECGWGERDVTTRWDVTLGISAGKIALVEPRFRGPEVVAPASASGEFSMPRLESPQWSRVNYRTIRLLATTAGNPNNSTNTAQGICLHVEMPLQEKIQAVINGSPVEISLTELVEGSRSGRLGEIGSACYRFHRAPKPNECRWTIDHADAPGNGPESHDAYYVRVRQRNDQWAWSSPVFVRK